MDPYLLPAVALSLAILGSTVLTAHPPDADGGHDGAIYAHADPATAQAWTNARTGEVVRGAFLTARDGKVSIERENGDVVVFVIDDLTPADRDEAKRRIAEVKAVNERLVGAGREGTKVSIARPEQAAPFDVFAPMVKIRWDERWLYVESDGMPHPPFTYPLMVGIKSWQQQVPLPQAYVGDNAWRIPLKPELADKPVSARTQLYRGAIALAANGVPIFNALNNRGEDAFRAGELDEYGGHSGRADDYHYHVAPLALQKFVGSDKPIAYALDGFPLYGLFDPTAKVGDEKTCPLHVTDKLDELNGHCGIKPDGSRGLYHYHATTTYPYSNGGMRGKVTVKDDQIDPQPRAAPIRPAQSPLRGASITGFKSESDKSWALDYQLGGRTFHLGYRINADGKYVFDFVDPDGGKKTESYTRRQDRPPGGDPSRPGGDRPAPPPRLDRREDDRLPRSNDARADTDLPLKQMDGFTLSSPAVGEDGRLPATYTCDGASQSPPLQWAKPPAGTKSLALVMHHVARDGDTHVYWVLHHIPADTVSLPTNVANVGKRGINTVNGRREYAPPCSKGPGDKTYTLTLYALTAEPKFDDAKTNVTRPMLLAAIKDSVLASTKLDVVYARPGGGDGERRSLLPGADRPRPPHVD